MQGTTTRNPETTTQSLGKMFQNLLIKAAADSR
jgi:hypothetical protein